MGIDSSVSQGASETDNKPVILIVDDSRLMRHAIKKILNKDFVCLQAVDGEDGWQKLTEDDSIQLVFSDLSMPVLDGYGLLERIRKADDSRISALPVIVITGNEENAGAKEKALQFGATDFITKPFQTVQLKECVAKHAEALVPVAVPELEAASTSDGLHAEVELAAPAVAEQDYSGGSEQVHKEAEAAEQAGQEQGRKEAEAAEQAAQEQARKEAEAAEQAAQEQARKEAEAAEQAVQEQARKEAEAAERAAQEQARKEAEAAERAAQEQARKEAEAAEQAAQEQARKEAEAAEQAAQEQARKEAEAAEQAAQEQARKAAEAAQQAARTSASITAAEMSTSLGVEQDDDSVRRRRAEQIAEMEAAAQSRQQHSDSDQFAEASREEETARIRAALEATRMVEEQDELEKYSILVSPFMRILIPVFEFFNDTFKLGYDQKLYKMRDRLK